MPVDLTPALQIIKQFEGFRAEAYLDPVGIWTIGYGDTGTVQAGDTITEPEAAAKVESRLLNSFYPALTRAVKTPLTNNQTCALLCFTYNLGTGQLVSSTLLKKLNAGDYAGAADEFSRWNKAGGKVLPGLTARRAAERQLFLA
jgi:lysozyme